VPSNCLAGGARRPSTLLFGPWKQPGVFDGGIAALTETALITSGGAWASRHREGRSRCSGRERNEYLYLTGGEARHRGDLHGPAKFLIELWGY